MDGPIRIFDRLEGYLYNLAVVALLLMMVITVTNALARYLFDRPITGTVNFVELYLMIAVIWFSAATLEKQGGNIAVDAFSKRFSRERMLLIRLVYSAAILVPLAILLRFMAVRTYTFFLSDATIGAIVRFPVFVSTGLFTVGLAFLIVRVLIQFAGHLVEARRTFGVTR